MTSQKVLLLIINIYKHVYIFIKGRRFDSWGKTNWKTNCLFSYLWKKIVVHEMIEKIYLNLPRALALDQIFKLFKLQQFCSTYSTQ